MESYGIIVQARVLALLILLEGTEILAMNTDARALQSVRDIAKHV